MKTKVLIVEDDFDLGNMLKQYLEINDFEVNRVFNGEEARFELSKNEYDVLVLDVMMPKEDGFTLAKKLKVTHPDLPFLFVTARKMKDDVITGLKLGADDYIIKPFDVDELILRIQNILKRSKPNLVPNEASYQIGIFKFEPKNLLLISPTGQSQLTEKEAQLLFFLYQKKDQLIKRQEILNFLWKEADFFNGRSMDVFITRLRKLLSEDKTIQIESIRGIGFRFYYKENSAVDISIKVAIIEDEKLASQYLTKLLNEIEIKLEIVAVLDSIKSAVAFFKKNTDIDLIFMDVELADGQSFEIFQDYELDIPIIFITAYQEHAIKAFKQNSIDYLLKPIKQEELRAALAKFKKNFLSQSFVNSKTSSDKPLEISTISDKKTITYRTRYLAKLGTRLISVNADMIAYFYVKDRLQFIKTKDGADLIIDKRMDKIEEDMNPNLFFRVNRQFILNYESIKKVVVWFGGKLKIEVSPAPHEDVIVGRLRTQELKKWLGE
jgi:DNA-binding response OmpR family regulator